MECCTQITVVNLCSECVGVEVVAARTDSRQDRVVVWKEMCRTMGPLPHGIAYESILVRDDDMRTRLDGHSVLVVLWDKRTEVLRHPLITADGPRAVSTG